MSAFSKDVVIHFDGETARVSPEQLAQLAGVHVRDVKNATDELVELGLLWRRPDGEFVATLPGRGPHG